MSRPGITYQDVANAAVELAAQGKNPTVDSVRILTGTGSSTTIAQHLKTWKMNQNNTKLLCLKENLPEELVLTMKGLWDRVITQADDKVTVIKQAFEQSLGETQEQLKQTQNDNTRWQQQHHQVKQEKESLAGDKSALEQIVRQFEDERITLKVTQEKLEQQLAEKQLRVDELRQLAQQAQSNLEHYREASREQRAADLQRHEQLQTQLEHANQQLRIELSSAIQQRYTTEHECEQLRQRNSAITIQYDACTAELATTQAQLLKVEKEAAQYLHSQQHWQNMHDQVQIRFEQQHSSFIEWQTKFALLSQQFDDAQEKLTELSEQNKFLAHEKWTLGQERAQLEGQLKQFASLKLVNQG